MHSKQRYIIFICSVILGELESFRNCKGFSIIFPKILRAKGVTEVRIFPIPLSIIFIFESEHFRFPFLYEKRPNLGSGM